MRISTIPTGRRQRRAAAALAVTAALAASAMTATAVPSSAERQPGGAAATTIEAGPVRSVRPPSRSRISRTAMVTDRAGTTTVVWDGGGRVSTARNRPDGSWRPPVTLGYGALPDAVVDGRNRVTVVWRRRNAEDLATRRWVGGAWEPVAHLTEPRDTEIHVWPFRIGVNAEGDTVVVWNRKYGPYDVNTWDRVEAAYRTDRGSWGAPVVLRKDYGFVHAASVDEEGGATVFYESDGLRLQRRGPGGTWQSSTRLRFGGGFAGLAATPGRHFVVSMLDGDDVVAHEKLPGDPWLRGVVVGAAPPYAQVAPVVVDGQDRATIAFAAADRSASVVHRVPGSSWTAPHAVSPVDLGARNIRLARGAQGALALAWVSGPSDSPRLWIATRSAGEWSTPLPLTGPRTREIPDVTMAFEPDGDVIVVWTSWLRRSHDFHLLSRTVSTVPAG